MGRKQKNNRRVERRQPESVSSETRTSGRSGVRTSAVLLVGVLLGASAMMFSSELKLLLFSHSSTNQSTQNEESPVKAGTAAVEQTSQTPSIPEEAKNFNATYLKSMTPRKQFIDGRRVPPIELLPQKEHNSSVRVFLFEEFLSETECDQLRRVHDSHVTQMNQQQARLCFDSIKTLRKHIKAARQWNINVSPNDFETGTMCLNETFSKQLSQWIKWSYSTAFYPGESKFSDIMAYRVNKSTGFEPKNGGKFQITSYPEGIGYKSHTDCTENNGDKRDRFGTILVYLNDVESGGETIFPKLGIKVTPRKGMAIAWNNMNSDGECESDSIHNAAKVVKGNKYILQRWYYYQSFYSLGRRAPEPSLPVRKENTGRVSCDEFEHGSCRWYDEWNYDHLIAYRQNQVTLI